MTKTEDKAAMAYQLRVNGDTFEDIGVTLGVSRQHAARLAATGAKLAGESISAVHHEDDDVTNRYKTARADRMQAMARIAKFKADEACGKLVRRDLVDEIFTELQGRIRRTSERMKRESPLCVEIFREGLKGFDAFVEGRLGPTVE